MDSSSGKDRVKHPAEGMGPHARKMFELAVEQVEIIRVPTKTSEALVNAGLLYDRPAGYDSSLRPTFRFSARIEAFDQYCAWLDEQEGANSQPPDSTKVPK